DITLFIFGGVSNMEEEARDAWDELRISAVGPLTSLALAAVFYGLSQIAGPRSDPLTAIVDYLALVNLMVAAFNLLPGFPLDGGRVLRSLIWMGTKDFVRATRVATTVGQVFAFLFIIWGVFLALSGNFLNGIWVAFIGWFLNSAADASRRDVEAREAFRGVRVALLMGGTPETVTPDVPVDELVHSRFLAGGRRALPVLRDGRLEGIVTVTDVKRVQRDAWASTRVGDIMTRAPLHTVRPDSEMAEALGLMAEKDLNQVPVVKDGALVGLLSRADIIRYLQYRSDLGIPPAASGGQRTPRP
ncbi:MAG: site-2 protease family protein, partial [Chloroflexota bacterium]